MIKIQTLSASVVCGLAVTINCLFFGACGPSPETRSENVLRGFTQSKSATLSFIDSINGISDFSHGTARVPRGQDLVVVGWAVDSAAKVPASQVYVDIDGKQYLAQYGVPRPDVAAVLKEPAFARSGFTATIPGFSSEGEHHVTLNVIASQGSSYYIGAKAAFELQ